MNIAKPEKQDLEAVWNLICMLNTLSYEQNLKAGWRRRRLRVVGRARQGRRVGCRHRSLRKLQFGLADGGAGNPAIARKQDYRPRIRHFGISPELKAALAKEA